MPRGPSSRAVMASAIVGSSVVALPPFLVAALAVVIHREFRFDEAVLGVVVGGFFLTSAAMSVIGGRVSEILGPRRAMLAAASLSMVALLGVGLLAADWRHVLVFLALAGCSNAIAHPAANLTLARGIRLGRQGLAFGVKQSSIPMATLFAGLSVPALGVTLGWRAAFIIAGLGVLGGIGVVARSLPSSVMGRGAPFGAARADVPAFSLTVLALGMAFGSAAAVSMAALMVPFAVESGWSPSAAGLLLSGASCSAVLTRILGGWVADRRVEGDLATVILMLGVGALAMLLLAVADVPLLVGMGALLAFGAGWGWPGLFNLAVVRHNSSAPAVATGITQTGAAMGAFAGPLALGMVVNTHGYTVAWLLAAGSATFAAILVWVGRNTLGPELSAQRPGASDPG